MTMILNDMHVHSNASDGRMFPKELIDYAIEKNIKKMALTDHDTLGGIQEAQDYAKDKSIEVISGIEISSEQKEIGVNDIHIIGLFIDSKNKVLNELIKKAQQERVNQKTGMVKKLQDLGYDITIEELRKVAKGSFGRPHVAKILIDKGYFPNIQVVFDKVLDNGKPAYVAPNQPTIEQSVKAILSAGGIPFLAHPGFYDQEKVSKIIEIFMRAGGKGLEIDYPYCQSGRISKEDCNKFKEEFRKVAEKNHLLISGGTDFHGTFSRDAEIGSHGINDEELNAIRAALIK